MAITSTYSHQFMIETIKKEHNITTDILKVVLMDTTFAFDPDIHAMWADCSANEIADGYGYTAGGETLNNVGAVIDTTGDKVDLTCDNVTWTAAGGPLPTTGAAIIYNSTHPNNTVVMCIDFDADYDTADGKLFQINFSNGLGTLDNA